MSSTIFHKIFNREIPAEIVWNGGNVIAIRDANPQAEFHVILIPSPKLWTSDLSSVLGTSSLKEAAATVSILGGLLSAAAIVSNANGYDSFRTVINTKTDENTIPYLHVHVLAGCEFTWPPGVKP